MTIAHEPRRQPQRPRLAPYASTAWTAPERFEDDPHAGRPKILFIGHADSSHTHAWIDLLVNAAFNVRLFALPSGLPPDGWHVRTYVTSPSLRQLDPRARQRLYPAGRLARAPMRAYARFVAGYRTLEERWLARIVREWKPDIVHTLGIDPAGELFFDVRREYRLENAARWIVQTRGGSDLALARFDQERAPRLGEVMRAADALLSDNAVNFEIALDWGVRPDQLSPLGTVPGTGGVDVDLLVAHANGPPSSRRSIVWPKAYECQWSKALPVFEALAQYWKRLPSCEIHVLATVPETRMWFQALPAAVRKACHLEHRIPRDQLFKLMGRSRVMLAPSLVDGTPNAMFEAMATGSFPILSPLATIKPLVRDQRNVLFARNLYPDEIGEALVRAMTDAALVDSAVEENLSLVRTLADRAKIRPRVVQMYEALAMTPRDR